MGFKFGYTKFAIGIVEIEVQNIDTEKYRGTINLEIPTAQGTFRLEFYSGSNWRDSRAVSFKVGFTQPDKPEEEEEPSEIDDGEWLEEREDA